MEWAGFKVHKCQVQKLELEYKFLIQSATVWMWTGGAVREDDRQAILERQQREGYTYEWLHTQVQHVAESPAPSNRKSEDADVSL